MSKQKTLIIEPGSRNRWYAIHMKKRGNHEYLDHTNGKVEELNGKNPSSVYFSSYDAAKEAVEKYNLQFNKKNMEVVKNLDKKHHLLCIKNAANCTPYIVVESPTSSFCRVGNLVMTIGDKVYDFDCNEYWSVGHFSSCSLMVRPLNPGEEVIIKFKG